MVTVFGRVIDVMLAALMNVYGFISYQFLFEFVANMVLAQIVFKFLSFFKTQLSIRDTKDMIDKATNQLKDILK